MLGKRRKDSLPHASSPGNFRSMLATDIDSAPASAAAAGGAEKRAYVKQIFSEIAPRYDLLNHLLSLNIDRRWRRKAIASLGVDRDKSGNYLDLCAEQSVTRQLMAKMATPARKAGIAVLPSWRATNKMRKARQSG